MPASAWLKEAGTGTSEQTSERKRRRGWLARLLRLGVALVVLLVVAMALLLVRLSRGPLSLDFLTQTVVRALEPADGSFRVQVGATELVWTDRWYDVDLRVRDVVCRDAAGTTLASLSSLAMELSVPALLRGLVAPREIELDAPQLTLVREPDGDIDFGLGQDTAAAGGESVFAKLFAGSTADGGAAPAAQFLKSVVVRDGKLALVDRQSGFRTDADAVAVEMTRDGAALDVSAATAVTVGSERIPVRATIVRDVTTTGTKLTLSFSDLEPAAALQTAHLLEPAPGSVGAAVLDAANYLRLPLSGTITAELDREDTVQKVELDGGATRGVIALPPPIDQQLAIERIALNATYDATSDAVELAHLEVDLGVPEIRLTGRWSGRDANALSAEATLINLPTDEIGRYWPAVAAKTARTWVTRNISGGTVREASVKLGATLVPAADPPSFTLHELTGKIAYRGLAVRYVDTMPPATAIDGNATFSSDGFDFRVASARVAGVTVPSATVLIAGFTRKITTIAIDAQTRGSIRDALRVVDAEPLHYAREIGIDPGTVDGSMTGRVKLGFPLDGAPIPPDLGVSVEAQLRDAAFPRAVGDWPLSAGNLNLRVGAGTLSIGGTASVAGVPCSVSWRETLGATSGVTRWVEVQSTVDAAGRAALGFDLKPWLTGPAAVDARIEQRHDGKGTASLGIDLTGATLDAPDLRLVKQPGTPARADLTLTIQGSRVVAVSPFSFQAPGAIAHGKATLGSSTPRIATLDIDGTLPPATAGDPSPQFVLTLQPAARANRFELTSNDASTLLRLLMPDARTQGGRLKFTGTVELETPGLPFSGDLGIKTLKLTQSPFLARLLMLSSLDGILSTMQGQGLSFDSFAVGIGYASKVVSFKDGVADGPSVRIVFNGSIDGSKGTGKDEVALDGTLVPSFYGLNTAAAKVPLIGGLFGGGDGEGVIAIDFTARGPITDPKISVKPLSSIAPGVLRSLARRLPW